MSADITSVLTRLAVLQQEIIDPGSGDPCVAYTEIPTTVNSADMPLFINFAGALTQNKVVDSDDRGQEFTEVRNYQMVLYLAPYATGQEGEMQQRLTPFIDLVHTKFAGLPHLRNLGGITASLITADTGVSSVMEFIGQKFYGVRFTLQVTGRVRRALASGD